MKRILAALIAVGVIAIALYASVLPSKNNLSLKSIKPELILNQIKALKEQESRTGDELFLTLNACVSGGVIEYKRIPAKPGHWLSRHIDEVKKISLWSQSLTEGQIATINIELNDEDAEPFNPDDLLGVVQVQLKNENGELVVHWDIPHRTGMAAPNKLESDVPDTMTEEPDHVQKFDLNNDGAHYQVYLSVKE